MLRRALLALACGLALSAAGSAAPGVARADSCANLAASDAERGIGGTGATDPDSGVGGTGAGDPDSGIGGTGAGDPDSGIGGTGVFGTITGFASICVNGLEVHYSDDVPVTWNGERASANDLRIGHVVWIVAEGHGGKLLARSIAVASAVIGTVDTSDAERRLLVVDGLEVEVPGGTWVFDSQNGVLDAAVGQRVEVSGLRRATGRVLASRIDRTTRAPQRSKAGTTHELLRSLPHLRRASLEGFVEPSSDGALRVGGVEIDARAIDARTPPPAGARVHVNGPLRNGVLRAERLVTDPPRPNLPVRPQAAPAPPATPKPADTKPPDVLRPEPPQRPELPPRPDLPPRPMRPEAFDRPVTP